MGAGCVVRPLSTGCPALHFNSRGIARLKEQAEIRGRPDPFEVRDSDPLCVLHVSHTVCAAPLALMLGVCVPRATSPAVHDLTHRPRHVAACGAQGKPKVWYASIMNNDTSVWKLNLVARVIRGMPVDNAITQVCTTTTAHRTNANGCARGCVCAVSM